ncbi:MAG: small subunit ribosomal protein S9 [Candidatus Paceibacteria bacterium]|jgi:small subunit ribosomal protein S9
MADKKYIGAIGRRKNATAQVRLTPDTKMTFVINGREIDDYFSVEEFQKVVRSPFGVVETKDQFHVSVLVRGGGISAQAGATRHGIARAIEKYNEELRSPLKAAGYLKRDPRRKERKKPGLRKARKRPAWSKR